MSAAYLSQRRLSPETKELLFILSLTVLRSQPAHIASHIRVALKLGVTAEEILEAMEIALPEAGVVAFQHGFDVWRDVVGAAGLEPTAPPSDMTRPKVEVWSDLHCPWALVAVHRLRAARDELGLPELVINPRAWPLEWVNGTGTPHDIVTTETAVLAQHEPALFNRYENDSWPSTFLPGLRARGRRTPGRRRPDWPRTSTTRCGSRSSGSRST